MSSITHGQERQWSQNDVRKTSNIPMHEYPFSSNNMSIIHTTDSQIRNINECPKEEEENQR